MEMIAIALGSFCAGAGALYWWQSRGNDALDEFFADICRVLRDPNEVWASQMTECGDSWHVSFVNSARKLEVCAESSKGYSPGCVIWPCAPDAGRRHQRMLDAAISVARVNELRRKLATPEPTP